MRRAQKQRLLNLVKTFHEANDVIRQYINAGDIKNSQALLAECQDTAIQMCSIIEKSEGEDCAPVHYFEEYCEVLFQIYTGVLLDMTADRAYELLNQKMSAAEKSVKDDIKIRLEVVFMPYKVSMWDCLESIWRAADEDPECDAYVVPIPYYDRNSDHCVEKFHYEGGEYPDYVPIVHYETYDLEEHKPDVIYIHNPYDDLNYVTSVNPRFYSWRLKKHTDMLVYVPYFVAGYYSSVSSVKKHIFSCFTHADLVVVQSENQKRLFSLNGVSDEKMAALGNPKADYIINVMPDIEIPKEWSDITAGKKVFLLNSSITKTINDNHWVEEMLAIIGLFRSEHNIVLLWRPHPLLRTSIKAMCSYKLKDFDYIMSALRDMENVIIDENSLAYSSMKLADAMISDYSSLVMQYSLTGKPVLLTVGSSKYKECKEVCFDYFSNYFVKDGVTVSEFVNRIMNDMDTRKEKRLKEVNQSLVNADGGCGCKVHRFVCEKLESIK